MSDTLGVVFLGVNDAGMRIYDWLCEQSGVFVHSLLTTEKQLRMVKNVQPTLMEKELLVVS